MTMNVPQDAINSLAEQIFSKARVYMTQGWRGVDDAKAPQSLTDMIAAENTRPFAYPVSHDNCETTIYQDCPDGGQSVNMAFRAWHDALHIIRQLDTNTLDEVEIGMIHVDAIVGEHEKAIILCDTVGQSMYYDRFNSFPTDQARFVAACYPYAMIAQRHGLDSYMIMRSAVRELPYAFQP